jgi:hypothetical protein
LASDIEDAIIRGFALGVGALIAKAFENILQAHPELEDIALPLMTTEEG